MSTDRIPHIDSMQEQAAVWYGHDLTDFKDQLEEAIEPVFERDTMVTIQLPTQDADAAKKLAQSKGVSLAELVREWVMERVHCL